ncbi:fimbrial protein [Proteus sp. NMG38-2]|uniref:fimbrial protein n=1 Tax=Proteus sp. NMG38-2 TaxID=2883107 RepID=UPI001D0BB0FD|nr:fimbrial protein [Proteus sp. NMG38-2]UDN35342.1 fimbrial protein [Proteus sp. NMG38-2]
MRHVNTKTILLLSGVLFYSTYTFSACIQNPNLRNIRVDIPNKVYSIQYDDMGTRVLEEIKINYKNGPINTYSGNDGQCGNASIFASYTNGWVPNVNKIVQTNIPGIGMKVYFNNIGAINFNWVSNSNEVGKTFHMPNPYWRVQIIKTGQVTQSGSLKLGEVAKAVQNNTAPRNTTWNLTSLFLPLNSIRINSLKCTTKSSSYNVNMGTWYDTQFKNIGDVSKDISIPITLSCAAGTNIKATVTSSAGYIDVNTGKLKLSGTNPATGIGIQLLDKNNNPIKLNTKNSLQNQVASGDYIFGWKARYIKTGSTITPGSANSIATVNILYE